MVDRQLEQVFCNNAIYSTAEIREIEQFAAALPNPPALMEKAGLAAAEVARDELLIQDRTDVLVLAGPGNNGGDAFVTARHLHTWWFKVTLVFTGERAGLSARVVFERLVDPVVVEPAAQHSHVVSGGITGAPDAFSTFRFIG